MSVTIRQKQLSDGRVSLYLDLYEKGQRSTEFLNLYFTSDKALNNEVWKIASKVRAEREVAILSGKHSMFHASKESFLAYVAKYQKNKSPASQALIRNCRIHLERFAGKQVSFTDINQQFCQHFLEYLQSQPLKKNTIWLYFYKFKTILRQATKDNHFIKSPCDSISVQGEATSPKYLTIDEIRLLSQTKCSNAHVKNAFLFCCFTGLRFSDMSRLHWSMVATNAISIQQQKTGGLVHIPLSPSALELLKIQASTPVSPWMRHVAFEESLIFKLPSKNIICRSLKAWAKKAGIDKVISFHWSRHSFATLLVNSGVDIFVVQELMGHKKIANTMIYARLLNPKKQEAVDSIPKLSA